MIQMDTINICVLKIEFCGFFFNSAILQIKYLTQNLLIIKRFSSEKKKKIFMLQNLRQNL